MLCPMMNLPVIHGVQEPSRDVSGQEYETQLLNSFVADVD